MKFFIPHVKDPQQAENILDGIKKFAQENLKWQPTNRRIFSISYRSEGKDHYAEVGKKDFETNEEIIAILEANAFLVCTFNNGVKKGMPILIGKDEVTNIVDFGE